MLIQPFLNYNFRHGWYFTSSPIITANWLAASSDRWTVPIGGGIGKLFRLGKLPVNTQLAAYQFFAAQAHSAWSKMVLAISFSEKSIAESKVLSGINVPSVN